jgi:hypothetical protein
MFEAGSAGQSSGERNDSCAEPHREVSFAQAEAREIAEAYRGEMIMERITLSELRRLTETRHHHCVSMFLPTHVTGPAAPQDVVRLKNLADQAEIQLVEHGMRAVEARELMQPIRGLPNDPLSWQQRGAGLAILVAPDEWHAFALRAAVSEGLVVNRRFHLKPLLPIVLGDQEFYILAFSKNRPRLILASRDVAIEVPVAEMPERIEVALNYQTAEPASQAHSATRGSDGGGKQGVVFHGQGGEPDSAKEELVQYVRLVAESLRPVLRASRLPLVVHAVEYAVPLVKQACAYPHTLEEVVLGNPDYFSPEQLRDRAWPLVRAYADEGQVRASAKFQRWQGTSKASDNIREIAPAARAGKIESLLVDTTSHLWGSMDPQSLLVELREAPRPGDDDLVDLAASETLSHRGEVYALEPARMPSGSPVAAVFRY